MNKAHLLLLATLVATTSGLASAETKTSHHHASERFYARLAGGLSMPHADLTTPKGSINAKIKNSAAFEASIGGSFTDNFRADLTIGYRNLGKLKEKDEDSVGKLKVNSYTGLANLYFDIHNNTRFTPYILAGLGLSIISTSESYKDATTNVKIKETGGTLAWNAGAGVMAQIKDNIYGDLAYKYIRLAKYSIESNSKKVSAGLYSHEFLAGLVFKF